MQHTTVSGKTSTGHDSYTLSDRADTGLENTMKFDSLAGQSYQIWREMVEWQQAGYAVAGKKSEVRACGTVPVIRTGGGRVALSTVAKGVRVSGMWRCGSRWCPECRAKLAAHKAAEVKQGVCWALNKGLVVTMVTLTSSHATVEELGKAEGSLHEAVQSITTEMARKRHSEAWRAATTGRRNAALKAGRVGTITAQENTVDDLMVSGSRTGTHWHRHHLAFLEPQAGLTANEVANQYGEKLFTYWQYGVESVGLRADRAGFDVVVAESEAHATAVAEYVAKVESKKSPSESLANELVRAESKSARRGGRVSPEQVLRNIGYLKAHGEDKRAERLIAQWKDIEQGTKGVHWLRWSPGLRDLVGLGEELTDLEIVNAEELQESEPVAVVSWEKLKEHLKEIRMAVRESLDGGEFDTLTLCLDSLGIDYVVKPASEWQEEVKAFLVASMRRKH